MVVGSVSVDVDDESKLVVLSLCMLVIIESLSDTVIVELPTVE